MRNSIKMYVLLIGVSAMLALGCCGDDCTCTTGLDWTNVKETNIDVRTSRINVATVTITPPMSGYVVVRFDGHAVAAKGDRLVLAASDRSANWLPNDGNVSFEGDNQTHSFSHSRVYTVDSTGSYNYYAVAHNYVNTNGTGQASIYGTLTAEFFSKKY